MFIDSGLDIQVFDSPGALPWLIVI
jgi:hypothetical protein